MTIPIDVISIDGAYEWPQNMLLVRKWHPQNTPSISNLFEHNTLVTAYLKLKDMDK